MLKGMGGLGGLGDMGKMMKAAQEMQQKMASLQDELATATVDGEAGAGLVRATVTGKGELTALEVDPSIFEPGQKEVVEDLIVAAVRDAQAKAREHSKDEMRRMTEAMGLPPGFKLPF